MIKGKHLAALLAATSPTVLVAQETIAQSEQIETIVVTAQRRNQAVTDVPMAITAVTAASLKRAQVRDAGDLTALAPGLAGKAQGLGTPVFSVRGISTNTVGIGGESSIGVFWDEGYLGRLESANIPFFDVERVEVLKGPQSTLFGRNASAGVISIMSRRPEFSLGGDVTASYASFDSFEVTGGLSIPLTEALAVRVAGLQRDRGGTERNVLLDRVEGGGETTALRGVIAFEPSSRLNVTGIVNYVRDAGGGFPSQTIDPALAATGGLTPDPFDGFHATNIPTFENRRLWSGNLQMRWTLNDALTLKSVTTGLDTRLERQFDVDGSAAPLLNGRFGNYRNKTFGQEFRLVGSGSRFNWFVGASLFEERVSQSFDYTFSEVALLSGNEIPMDTAFQGQAAFFVCDEPLTTAVFSLACSNEARETINASGRNTSYAAFGDGTFNVTDHIRATVGARLSFDRKRFAYSAPPVVTVGSGLTGNNLFAAPTAAPQTFDKSWTSIQPRFALDYKPDARTIIFASASRGFKAGGFDPAFEVSRVPFERESVWAYEVGTRTRMIAGTLGLGLSAFFLDYDDYQLQVLRNGTTSTLNAPKVTSYGAEFEGSWRPTRRLTFDANLVLNQSTFRSLDTDIGSLRGNRLLYAPDLTAFAAINYDAIKNEALVGTFRASVRHEARQFFTKENRPDESQGPYSVVDLSATLRFVPADFQIRVFARNLLNERYLIYAVDQGFGVVTNRGEPRIIGVEGSWTF
ncbi:MAG: TonB-dependent receptor [Aquidulcibacter sp.]|jgi:iron complex outermembrane receptor protein|uniref:TonB-dependent receptor n=1 Tax=Aquidulcibacter sp. TaxID=2052990 RepID=UPI0022BC27F2|nr:TonB-dependent receptor [Aquidulcibacter sp.]MCE2990581.1 TonB-dependent receptor [Nitrosomonadaceae bacterium]MCZ8208148.1 TonB-dependent receptor [Aquidulcibacter sp.]